MVRFTREAVEQGAVFLDTAEVYGPYTSEEIIGEALEGIRDQVTFTDGEMQQINRELDQIQIIGARYNAQQESLLEK